MSDKASIEPAAASEGPPAAPKVESSTSVAPTTGAPSEAAKTETKIDDRDKQCSGGHGIGLDDLKVKPEFVLEERAKSLGPIPVVPEGQPQARVDDRDNPDNGKRNKRRKKRRGQNKKRPRDAREADDHKVCMAVLRGSPCPFGDSCRFSHDLSGYMNTRPTDICELADAFDGCPTFRNTGYCFYGAICRVGSCHITKMGENVRNETVMAEYRKQQEKQYGRRGVLAEGEDEPSINSGNLLPRDVVTQLRKKTYPFECKRYFEKNEKPKAAAMDPPKDMNSPSIIDTESTPVVANEASSDPTPLDKLKTKKIVDFSNKVYVAPLTTVGNLPFRRIMKKFGADITCGEMAVATNLLEGKPSEWALLKRHPSEDVFGIQLAAAHPDQFTRISEVIEKYTDVDFVDMNLGCPLDLLCNKGAGAALMMREKKLMGALEGMSKNLSCSITVKMRTGWNIHRPFAHELVPKIQSWKIGGLAAIMIHGRSRLQRYKLDANWDYISQVADSQSADIPTIPLIGNGDVFSFTEYKEKVLAHDNLSQTAMLGRGALIKPWLPTEIKEKRDWDISSSERLDILKDFVKFGLEHWGSDQQGLNNTRRFLLEWLSFLYRYVPVGLLEVLPQKMNQRPPLYMQGRNDLETLFLSPHSSDWVKISEMLLGPVPEDFAFQPKHKSNAYETNG